MKTRISTLMVSAMLCAFTLLPATTMAQMTRTPKRMPPVGRERGERHPAIRQAIRALQGAKDDLQDAARDFCGHREDAAESVNNALSQLRLALRSDRAGLEPIDNAQTGNIFEKAAWSSADVRGEERHPKIRQAIRALNRAKDDLQDASHDFQGHREAALDATNKAITRLQAALACDRK